jgi:hypothetical protein
MAEPSEGGRRPDARGAPGEGADRADPISRFAPHLREEFDELRTSESHILKALADPATARRFAADPARALEEIGVKVPPAIKARLASTRPPMTLPGERRFRLPNGQVVTAHVKVRFTDGKPNGKRDDRTDGKGA